MSHELSGIITSFRINTEMPHVILVGNFYFIPTEIKWQKGYQEKSIPPFEKLSTATRKLIRDLSFSGPCAYIETSFFVEGIQRSEVWENGISESGPAISFHGYRQEQLESFLKKYSEFNIVGHSVNLALNRIGIFCHDGMDEFDSARLGDYRSNSEVMQEYELAKLKS